MYYDNRRQILDQTDKIEIDQSKKLLDSSPLANAAICKNHRFLFKLPYLLPYNQYGSSRRTGQYRSFIEVGVRNFLKGYLASEPLYGLTGFEFAKVKDLISFIHGFKPTKGIRISPASISNLKHRRIIIRPVPPTEENLAFVSYLKSAFPHFDSTTFLQRNL